MAKSIQNAFNCLTAGKGDEKTKDKTDDGKSESQTESQTNKDEGKLTESDTHNIIYGALSVYHKPE